MRRSRPADACRRSSRPRRPAHAARPPKSAAGSGERARPDAQRRAISTVAASASGRSANSAVISARVLNRCSPSIAAGRSRPRSGLPRWRSARHAPRSPRPLRRTAHWSPPAECSCIGEIEERRLGLPLGGRAVPLQLDIEAVAEQFEQLVAAGGRKIELAGDDRKIETAGRSARQGDQPLGLTGEPGQAQMRGLVRRVSMKARN